MSLHFSVLFVTSCLDSQAIVTGRVAGAGGTGGGVSGGFEELMVDGGEKPENFDPKDDLEGFFIGYGIWGFLTGKGGVTLSCSKKKNVHQKLYTCKMQLLKQTL